MIEKIINYFRAVLVSQHNWIESTEFPHITSLHTHRLLHCQRPTSVYQWGTFVIIDEPTVTYFYQPKSLVNIRVYSHSMSSDKYIMMCIHHCNTLQESLIALNILYAPPIYPPLPQNPVTGNLFYCLHSFTFLGMSYI